jgi:hypothetical protein
MESQKAEYGDVVFPIVEEASDPWSEDCYASLISKKEIREEYYIEVRNILNGHINSRSDYEEDFMEDYRHIKWNTETMHRIKFEWLKLKEAQQIIKKWEGDPLSVLYYLVRNGIIEKAVTQKAKIRGTK